jgi:predicted ATPase
VLYDQPESNMEKEFLLSTLATKLDQLRRSHQILIATHEPLLVVNADANELILATNEKRVGQGNQVHYVNRSFVGVHGKTEAIEEVAKLIDGGTMAVRHRSEVYEGMINGEY